MLPQPPRQIRPQSNQSSSSPASAPFITNNSPFEPSPYYTPDLNVLAKMDTINAANLQRQLTSTNMQQAMASTSHIPVGGTTRAPFVGGISSSYNPPNSLPGAPTGVSNGMQFNANSSSAPSAAYVSHHNGAQQSAPPSFDASMQTTSGPSRQQSINPTLKQKQRTSFLNGLASIHISRGHPLPPALTGVPYPPNYDPANSPWKNIDCSPNDIGVFRLAGKDIDLLKLWGILLPLGGGVKVSQNAWPQILQQFDLPEFLPAPLPNSQRSVAALLSSYYSAILSPFEEMYRRNFQDSNRKAMVSAGRPPGSLGPNSTLNTPQPTTLSGPNSQATGTANNATGSLNQSVSGNHHPPVPSNGSPPAAALQQSPQSPHASQAVPTTTVSGKFSDNFVGHSPAQSSSVTTHGQQPASTGDDRHERDAPGVKRRLESEEVDGKRAKLKTGGSEMPDSSSMSITTERSLAPNTSSSTTPAASNGQRSHFMRTKVEYIPLAREVDTYGGLDLNVLEDEYQRAQRRAMRDINEWGTVDIEALTMSIRSRLATELSYALTTFTLLSTMKGPTPGSGFPISQCTDLLEEVLDLLEDEAFDGLADTPQYPLTEDTRIPRHRELVALTYDAESLPFAGLKNEGHLQKPSGPRHRSGNIVLAVINIIRNLSVIPDNVQFLAKHERTLELVLRTCGVIIPPDGSPLQAVSRALSLTDVIHVRRDALYILCNLSSMISFSSTPSPCDSTVRVVTRIFELVASVLIEPLDAVSPVHMMKVYGVPFQSCKPPSLPDVALDVFTRIAHLDQNRRVFSAVIPQGWIWRLLETLVYRLPVLDPDFAFLNREAWLSYLEKATMAIYALAFLSRPELKRRIKSDRRLCFSQVMLRMAQKLVTITALPEARQWFMVTARRAVEALKVVDDEDDAFDTSHSTQPTLAFGMGFGETGETMVEKGTGILAGRRDVGWEMLMQRDLDPVMFAELESLMRVE